MLRWHLGSATFSGHPDLKDDLGEPVDDHPSVHHLFEAHMPSSHPNIDDLMQEGYTLPSWHPDISKVVAPRPLVTSPEMLLAVAVGALFIMIILSKSITKWRNSKRRMKLILAKSIPGKTSSSSKDMSDSQEDYTDVNSYPIPNKE